jgi:hypothetical protein
MAAPNSPYLAGLTASDFLFPRMKSQLRRRRFQDVIEIQEQLLTLLHAMPKRQFLQCFQSGRNTVPAALTRKEIGLVWFICSFIQSLDTSITDNNLYVTTYNIWASIQYNTINNNTKFKDQLEVEFVYF